MAISSGPPQPRNRGERLGRGPGRTRSGLLMQGAAPAQDAPNGKASRRAVLVRLAASGELIFSPHFPNPGVGRIVPAGDGFAWRPELK